jgi:hypothetical protein
MNDDEKTGIANLPVIVIEQGRANPAFFHIIEPVPGRRFIIGQRVKCINPKTKVEINGVITEHFWTFPWDEAPVGFFLGIWGYEPKLLRNVLLKHDERFNDSWVRIILVHETE